MNYKRLLKQYKVDMIDTLRRFVQIPSVNDPKTVTKEMPFGKSVDDALKFVGELGERFGFEVDYCDGYATELSIGSGKKLIGIFAHADVVPATGNWSSDPFTPVIKDNVMYGRGVSDDKGPFVSAFYAVKALKDNHLIDDYRVRIVVGGDEELGSRCMEYYFHKLNKEAPTYGFTPDSAFPLIYGEKAIGDFSPSLEVEIPNVRYIDGGLVSNAVCDKVVVKMHYDENFVKYLKANGVQFKVEDDGLIFYGKSSHGSMPELGVNAALICLKSLGDFYEVEEIKKLGEKLQDTTGKSFNCFTHSELLEDSTFCVGKIHYENGKLQLVVNYRFSNEVSFEETVKKFDEFFSTKSSCDKDISKALLYDPNCALVKTLLKAYKKVTHDRHAKAMCTGGGTYAKHCPNTVAFGAEFPGHESRMHEPDELFTIDDLFLSAVIYARAIVMLGKLNEN